jgi:potassium channel subfamily K protein 1
MISACVERLLIFSNKLYDMMKNSALFLNKQNLINLQILTYTHLMIVASFIIVSFFLIPAAIFSSMEKEWNYLDALYYCFVSLSTIG